MASFAMVVLLLTWVAAASALKNITLVVMAPFPGELTSGWTSGHSLVPATIVAAREINNSTAILPGYHLDLIVADSGCSVSSQAVIRFVEHIFEDRNRKVAGIVGPGCSAAALRISDLTARRKVSLIHITPSATTPLLEEDRRVTTYATISSALSYVQSFIQIMEYNNWSSVATLQDESRLYFKQTHSEFKRMVENRKVIFTGSLLAGEESVIPLETLRASQGRVVMVFAGSKVATQLLCYAYHENMLYPNYQWIFHDRTRGHLLTSVSEFKVSGRAYSCTVEEMAEATHGVILNLFHIEQESKDTILPLFNRTYNDYYRDYEKQLEKYRIENGLDENPANIWANSYHDAVWAFALALHKASSLDGVDLDSYTYDRHSDTVKIAEHLQRVDFNGMSGPVTFQNHTRSVKTIIDIKQLWNGEDLLIGTFDRSRRDVLQINSTIAKFINDTHTVRQVKVHTAVGIVAILITAALVILIALLQLANFVWYHHCSIKATSPNIRHLIFSGCYLYAMFLIFYSIQQAFEGVSFQFFSLLCNAMVWCIVLGYSLIFSTVCVTIWRIYRLFKHFRNERPGMTLSDNFLVLCVILLLLVDVSICVAWNWIDPLMLKMQSLPALSTPLESVYTHQCDCQYWSYWIGSIIAYKTTVILPLVILSILNRRIKRKNFQRTKNITILVYTLFILAGVGIPLYFLLRHQNVYVGFFLLFCVIYFTILLCCLVLFLPPVLSVVKQRKRKEIPPKRQLARLSSTASMISSAG